MRMLAPGIEPTVAVPYTLFKEQVSRGNVQSIYSRGQNIEGQFVTPVAVPQPERTDQRLGTEPPVTAKNFNTLLPVFIDPGFEAFLIDHNVEIRAVPIQERSPWATILFGFGPAILIIGFYVWLYRRAMGRAGGMGGAMFGMGKSKARRYDQDQDNKVTFDDVAGIDEIGRASCRGRERNKGG